VRAASKDIYDEVTDRKEYKRKEDVTSHSNQFGKGQKNNVNDFAEVTVKCISTLIAVSDVCAVKIAFYDFHGIRRKRSFFSSDIDTKRVRFFLMMF
jgi:hypothetical protein